MRRQGFAQLENIRVSNAKHRKPEPAVRPENAIQRGAQELAALFKDPDKPPVFLLGAGASYPRGRANGSRRCPVDHRTSLLKKCSRGAPWVVPVSRKASLIRLHRWQFQRVETRNTRVACVQCQV